MYSPLQKSTKAERVRPAKPQKSSNPAPGSLVPTKNSVSAPPAAKTQLNSFENTQPS